MGGSLSHRIPHAVQAVRQFGKHGVLFALVAMVAQALYFGAVDFPAMTPTERAVDNVIGWCLFLALQNAARR